MSTKTSLIKTVRFWGSLLLIGTGLIIISLDIWMEFRDLEQRTAHIRQSYTEQKEQLIKEQVLRVASRIKHDLSLTDGITRKRIHTRVSEAHAIASHIYEQNKEQRSDDEIKRMILDALRPVRFEDGVGYYFITTENGDVVLNAANPELENTNVLDLKDAKDDLFIRKFIKIAGEKSGEGFHQYQWRKPGITGNDFTKLAFVKRFDPYGWVIGTGLYTTDTKEQLKEDLLNAIMRVRFGAEGYIFVANYDGDILVSNGKRFINRKFWEVFDKNPEESRRIYYMGHEVALKPDGDYIYYSHPRLSDPAKISRKTSFIYGIPDMNLFVGAGLYLDDVDDEIETLHQSLNQHIISRFAYFSVIVAVMILFNLLLIGWFGRHITNDFRLFISFFNRATNTKQLIDRSLIEFDELDSLARYANRMLKEREGLEEKMQTFYQAIEQSPISVVITDTEGNIEFANTAYEEASGYRVHELVGQKHDFFDPEGTPHKIAEELLKTIHSGESWNGELLCSRREGDSFWVHTNIAPVVDESGQVRHYLAISEDITEKKLQQEQILHQAHFDSLTDLPNRFLSLDRLSQLVKEAQRDGEHVAVLFLDLDDFKKINDSLGHETGDKLLIDAAQRLESVVRKQDTVGRLGGDEFIVLLGGLAEPSDAQTSAENLLEQFRTPFRIDGRDLILTSSIGISVYPEDGDDATVLLRNADSAMYHAKESGRNTYSYFTDAMNQEVSRRLNLEEQIHGAIERREFTVFYQPQIEIASGRIIGAEALLRWNNPAIGNVSPVEFIPVAEQTGMIIPLGKLVLQEALDAAREWQSEFDDRFRIAINLSPRQFRDPDLVQYIEGSLGDFGIGGESLELEITEGVLLSGHTYVQQSLAAFNRLNISLAMDDFGTGYSSINYLRSYPFDVIKIDRSFVNDITSDPKDRELINAMIAMAHGLNLKVVAEGVETTEQLQHLKELGCDYAQGYLFSKPVPREAFSKRMEATGLEQTSIPGG
jgi:diguanylate cyclase (GGDEF)-like protein/PAS domain S-box-containing protein